MTVTGDATDPTAVGAALEGVDAVVHCAALVATEARRAREILDTNVRLVEVVLGGAAERGISTIVYISSVLALFAPGSPIDEHSSLSAVRSPYAQSKAASEEFIRALGHKGAQICTLYPPAIIGPEDPGLS
ncbi:MAG TPA: NAD-dependent epimerase/dehydratase family protein, partial [Mycobacterium sp.]|nr:NAD-dependent epimerase/dehydratase family protein [Mycobacterium sp.]